MKYILILVTALTLTVNTMYANSWSFTKEDLTSISEEQSKVLLMAKKIGEYHGLNDVLVFIAAVETRLGVVNSTNNRYCGVMQIDITYHDDVTCELLENNLYLSMEIAASEMKKWLAIHNNNLEKALLGYNRGYLVSTHDAEYIRRIHMVESVYRSVGL